MSGNELQGVDIGRLLRSKGPTVTCVLLKAGIGGEGNEQKKGKKEKKETETRPDSARMLCRQMLVEILPTRSESC